MLNLILGAIVSFIATPLLMRAGDDVLSRVGTRVQWTGPGPEATSRFFGRIGLAVVAVAVWLAVLFATSAVLYWLLPPSP